MSTTGTARPACPSAALTTGAYSVSASSTLASPCSMRAQRILAEWGEEGRDAARLSLWLDFPYLAVYSVFWLLAVRAA